MLTKTPKALHIFFQVLEYTSKTFVPSFCHVGRQLLRFSVTIKESMNLVPTIIGLMKKYFSI